MKLWLRIFISILIVSLAALLASSTYLINKNHSNNITLEQNRSLNEYDFIRSSISNSIDLTTTSKEAIKILFNRYGEYYDNRGIHLTIYHDGEYLYHNLNDIDKEEYEALLSLQADTKMVRILESKQNHYILVSGFLAGADGPALIYAREINEIYTARSTSIRLTVIFTAGLALVLGLLSYFYSRWITKPIENLHQGALMISQGYYAVRVPETKDEFKDLAAAFNSMSTAIQERTSELEERAKELQEFIDDLSHEMNTPLTSIQGYAEFLKNANTTEENRLNASENIIRQAARMKDIYTKLMAITLTRNQKLELTNESIKDLFEDIADTFITQTAPLHITINFEDHLASLLMDRTLIYMLLCNLVKNSIQALPDGGIVTVEAYTEHKNAILEVSDNGLGIPEDNIRDVTKPFYRVDKSRSRKTGGAGLGLSICSNIAKLHHAQLSITSKPGAGTTVKIIFD